MQYVTKESAEAIFLLLHFLALGIVAVAVALESGDKLSTFILESTVRPIRNIYMTILFK